MEAGGPEIENMVFSDDLKDSTNEEGKAKQEGNKEVEVNGEADKGNGVISNFVSSFVSGREKDDHKVEGVEEVNKSDVLEDKNKEEKEGGILNHLISMVTPNQESINTESEDGQRVSSSEVEADKNGLIVEDKDGGGGGVIHNLISNILYPNNGENNKIGEDEQVIRAGGGDVAENGDSHLPINDEDDRGTTTSDIEEASMLIHSIVHD